ncbi:MAG: serine acetyltransferase [Saprospiraceae bacterium]|nr:serine acetyltransferase [Saprospiraceae bacterium]
MEDPFLQKLYESHRAVKQVPSPEQVCTVIDGLLKILFPELADRTYDSRRDFELHFQRIEMELYRILATLGSSLGQTPELIEKQFMARLPEVHALLLKDAEAISSGDPAATSQTEVIRTYPGFFAIAVYRVAHELQRLQVPLIPRILTEHAHSQTGIDIHPGATIGEYFCIDHGTGLVIGETVDIGDHVKIYQGVTLGALSVRKDLAKTKRHPTIEDRVVIYSGATILGGDTVIGHDSVIGGNVWLTQSVPPHSVIYYKGDGGGKGDRGDRGDKGDKG